MSETLTSSIKVALSAVLVGDADIGNRSANIPFSESHAFTHGTGANQANQIFADTRQIAASTTEDLDLYGGFTSPLGTTLNFAKIKAIVIYAHTTNTNNVLVGGDAASVPIFGNVNDLISIRPGGLFVITAPDSAGIAVTQTTGDILQIANSSSGSVVDYDIVVIGVV